MTYIVSDGALNSTHSTQVSQETFGYSCSGPLEARGPWRKASLLNRLWRH